MSPLPILRIVFGTLPPIRRTIRLSEHCRVRRRFVNNTGGAVTRLRFRVLDQTTFPAPSGFADLRTRTSWLCRSGWQNMPALLLRPEHNLLRPLRHRTRHHLGTATGAAEWRCIQRLIFGRYGYAGVSHSPMVPSITSVPVGASGNQTLQILR